MKSVLFSSEAYRELARRLAHCAQLATGQIEIHRFPDGERYMRIVDDVRDKDVYLLSSSFDDDNAMLTYDIACGLVDHGAKRLTLLMPYFGYATMERCIKRGEVVTAKNRARLFSAIPRSPFGNRIFTIDLHSEGIPHYFGEDIRVFHVYAKPAIIKAARTIGGSDFVLASTDAGRAKWVESLANDIGVSASFVYKRRLSGETTKVTAVSAQVENKTVIIYDDMIRTGGSLIGAAKAYRSAGASEVFAISTHGIFPAGAIERIQESGLIKRLIVTDSHPQAVQSVKDFPSFVTLVGLENILTEAIKERG